jgi:hypothetical protein
VEAGGALLFELAVFDGSTGEAATGGGGFCLRHACIDDFYSRVGYIVPFVSG